MSVDLTENHKFIMYCTDTCPYCQDAMALFSDMNLPFQKIKVDLESDTWSGLKAAYDHNTVPMIFRNHDEDLYEIIGGFDDLKEYLNYYQEENEPEEE